jgi:hypothetical protein
VFKLRGFSQGRTSIYIRSLLKQQSLSVSNRISRVVVSALAPSVVDPVCSSPDRIKPKTIKLVFVASVLRTQHLGERAKRENKLIFNEMMMMMSALY